MTGQHKSPWIDPYSEELSRRLRGHMDRLEDRIGWASTEELTVMISLASAELAFRHNGAWVANSLSTIAKRAARCKRGGRHD